jgi:hypothetical protein
MQLFLMTDSIGSERRPVDLGDNSLMKLDTDPFPMSMINFEEKKVLVCDD